MFVSTQLLKFSGCAELSDFVFELKYTNGPFKMCNFDDSVLKVCFCAFATRQCQQRCFFCLSATFVLQILLPRYLMNALNDFDKTDLEYSLPLTDDLIRGQR